MNDELEALERLHEFAWSNEEYKNDIDNTDYQIVERALKEKQYLDHFLDTIFDTYDDVEIVGEYDEDLRKYCVTIKFDGSELHFYCDRDEFLYWREISGVDDQYGPEDLK